MYNKTRDLSFLHLLYIVRPSPKKKKSNKRILSQYTSLTYTSSKTHRNTRERKEKKKIRDFPVHTFSTLHEGHIHIAARQRRRSDSSSIKPRLSNESRRSRLSIIYFLYVYLYTRILYTARYYIIYIRGTRARNASNDYLPLRLSRAAACIYIE